MWTYHPDLLERPVPRYTSYPTAADFVDSVGVAEHEAALDGIAPGQCMSLYVHIPFCEQICWYCGCNTAKSNHVARLDSYLNALNAEIDLVAQRLSGNGRVKRIAFGGGSPNALGPLRFTRLLDMLMLSFRLENPLFSIELDPRSFTDDWARVIQGAQISHASLGVQTFDPELQQAIGRVQPKKDIIATVDALRRAGISSLNLDMMYGLPGQSRAELDSCLTQAIALQPDRIALFGYAHVPTLIPRQRQIDDSELPGATERFAMAKLGYERLVDAGYYPVGFDHFALPHDRLAKVAKSGILRRNFQGFTDDQSDVLLGLGASAISEFPDLIVQNAKNIGDYRRRLEAGGLSSSRGIRRTLDDQRRAAIIADILCHGSADLSALHDGGGNCGQLAPFMERGLVTYHDYVLRLAPEGLPYARAIAAQFDSYRNLAPKVLSSAI
ncbi:oxygen-independent coproporphyrinogen III oxidase [Alterisphingorhabdus coralli]|uniref:Coproporphyrinogen-III oxidase n=1 Tax=Alterisphingorhabdus coralli TaxID=3071408 RepID=A0AA97F6J6_9SPHN|nr:oxygen-independent coproporphyrinogen III oxidase [Parasphingorhabdus sp. SCSIO 66989]WOE75329.1 oxygen-independent coproporphyrinogen III oxidase [Parasphingorhabdus sp. SCSIO 66989]